MGKPLSSNESRKRESSGGFEAKTCLSCQVSVSEAEESR